MSWTYGQTSGNLWHNGVLLGRAYSGYMEHHNVHADQALHGLGPIPVGRYKIGEFFDDLEPEPPDGKQHKGPIVAHLYPCSDTVTFDRSGFMLHGDNAEQNFSGSDGCIAAAKNLRLAVRDSGELDLNVIDDSENTEDQAA